MWDDRLQELLAFQRKHGHINVPRRGCDNSRLAHWVINQRRLIRTGALSPERVRRLEDLGLRWPSARERARARDGEWDRRCAELEEFHRAQGHAEVPSSRSATADLARWVARQRHQLRAGTLRPDRRQRLEKAGISWPAERGRSRARDHEWDRLCDTLAAYARDHGNCSVPKDWSENPRLARWVVRQRHALRSRTLRPDRRARLEELDLNRPPELPALPAPAPSPRELAWQKRFESLSAFQKAHGHCNVPRRWPWNPALARWVHHQRDLRRRGLLNALRSARLDALGSDWSGNRGIASQA